MCCYTTVAAAAAAVRHRVPDDKFCSRGLLHLIPVISFSSFKHDFFNEPLGSTVAFSASILPIIHIIHPRCYGHARSQGGR